MEQKYKAGIISRTHYSDLLRLSLLAQHGGVWLDATFYCSAPCIEEYFRMPLWSVKRPDYSHISAACGGFATYSLGCSYDNRWVFATIRDFVLHYWQENDMLIDYLMLDYLIVLAQRKDPRIAELFGSIVPNNPRCDDLGNVLAEPFDVRQWAQLKENTALFKLTWKQQFPRQKDGQSTFFGKLLEEDLT